MDAPHKPPIYLDQLPRDFYARHAVEVAPELLNKILVRDDGRAARIVEVEAYGGGEDPAAHSFRGQTTRNATMFGPAGHLYVYLSYGIHWCSNVVCGEVGIAVAVLLRAVEPLHGLASMRSARPVGVKESDLANGPGKLCQAFGITRAHDGADLVTADRGFKIMSDGILPPVDPLVGPRVGISKAVDFPWRWQVRRSPPPSSRPTRIRPGRYRVNGS